MDEFTIGTILDYIWVPIVTAMAWLWSRFAGIDVRTTLLEQAERHYKHQRQEDQARHAKDRDEMLRKIENHHKVVMNKLDQVETRVKNGH